MKVDFFAALTRCFLTTDLQPGLYFKLCKFLSICTPEELFFLKNCPITYNGINTAIISSLFQYGLFTQKEKDDGSGDICYILSDFAIALKQNSLNYDDGLHGASRLTSYELLAPLNLTEPTTMGQFSLEPIEPEEIKKAVDNAYRDTKLILDGGTAGD